MQEDKIKESFANVRQDIDYLYYEIQELKRTIEEIKELQTEILKKQTDNRQSTDTSTHNLPLEDVKSPNLTISSGNEGVPTDRQTDQQTDRQPPHFLWNKRENLQNLSSNNSEIHIKSSEKDKIMEKLPILAQLHRASEFLESLDELKKEVRVKFKKLTSQEMQVFSKIYELEEQGLIVDYTLLAEKLSLTESSIRDYVLRLIRKGIPVEKHKENNKRITLFISRELRKIAPLETIHQLRSI